MCAVFYRYLATSPGYHFAGRNLARVRVRVSIRVRVLGLGLVLGLALWLGLGLALWLGLGLWLGLVVSGRSFMNPTNSI